jgi:hypothetical protein
MPGPVLTMQASILCPHGGQVTPTGASNALLIDGAPVLTIATSGVVVGCPAVGQQNEPMPCTTVQFMPDADLIVGGELVLTMSVNSVCMPHGQPAQIVDPGQWRVLV